jgi:bifunctional DNA-binding transcriptional regulator/antitoxin component of YhaV-PrlF toxin-antitoxin module
MPKMTTKGQVTIPKRMRDYLGLEARPIPRKKADRPELTSRGNIAPEGI